jgi:hypothetical protein
VEVEITLLSGEEEESETKIHLEGLGHLGEFGQLGRLGEPGELGRLERLGHLEPLGRGEKSRPEL